jgi:hypothetical protein
MSAIDPSRERARIASVYAAMTDEELQQAGEEPAKLTDWAFEALREEMQNRKLDWPGKDMPLPSQMPPLVPKEDNENRPVILRRYRDMPAAFVGKSILDDAGIDAFLQDDNVVRMDWFWSNAVGGIKLVVRQKDADDAEKILADAESAEPPDAGQAPA